MTKARTGNALLLLAALLLLWQGLFEYAGSTAITSPLSTFAYAAQLLASSFFWSHVGATMLAFAIALTLSAVLGVSFGLIFGLWRFCGDVAEPIIASIYTIPKITLYPVMLLVFGLGISAKIAFGVIHGTIPVLLFTLAAVKNLPRVHFRTARVMRLSPVQIATRILVPSLLSEIVSGLRIGFALTLLGVLIGEMFASQRGLGYLIINGVNASNVAMAMAVTLIIVVFAVATNGALLALDRRMHHGR